MPEALLEARNVSKSFGALLVTHHVSLSLHRGEIHALIGPNGAGKTTLLAQLSGQLRPDSGGVFHRGRDVSRLGLAQRARLGVARSFQITAVLPNFTALENVATAAQARARHHFRFWRDAARDRTLNGAAMELLERVGLQDAAQLPAAQLSHGQRRQLELAMALATRPQALLLDEPMAGMGPSETEAMSALVAELGRDHAVLLVEHDMDVVFRLAERISVLVYGSVIASGRPEAVRADPEVQRAYLSEEG